MLVAMTYNTYLCSAIVIGAFLGHLVYEGQLDLNSVLNGSSARGLACH
jgi:copper transporter 1